MTGPRVERELFFTIAEFEDRIARLRGAMAARGIDTLIVSTPENIFHLSGHQTFGYYNYQVLVVPQDRAPFLVLRFLESVQTARYAWVDDVVPWEDTEDPVTVTVEAMRTRGLVAGTVGVDENGTFLKVSTWKKFRDALPRLVDGSGLVERIRAVKSPQEIAYMREAAKLTDRAMAAAIAEIRPGASENDLAAAAFDAMTRAGSEYLTRDPIVTSGDRSGLPHTTYMRRRLVDGDAVLLEMTGVHNRYHAPLMRGAVVGRPSPLVERMAAVCLEGLEAAMAAIRPGVTSGEVDDAVRGIILREGLWENYRKRVGYSVGIGFSTWVEGTIASLQEDDPTVLVPGMCFHLPIALRFYGEAGLGFSETIVVTDTGCEALGRSPRRLARCGEAIA